MLIGYARVSTPEQEISLQQDALLAAGCQKIFVDIASGSKANRDGLSQALDFARSGDTLVVWRLDRLGRSVQHLLHTVQELQANKIEFKSLQENIDTSSSTGKLVFHVFSALAEFERDLITERTCAGLKAARARGRLGGRPKALNERQIKSMIELYNSGNDIAEICRTFNISKKTFYNYIKIENSCPVRHNSGNC
jgi:DNA invertase Pin-like site-specific DNA recombinase